MTVPSSLELHIERMAQGGDGVGRHEGGVVFVRGGLPGERVRVRVVERKARYMRGIVTEVIEASPARIAPRLPEADHISWQHIAYDAQVRFKTEIVREQLEKLAGLRTPPVEAMIPAEQTWEYRNTAHLQVQGSRVGYYAAGTNTLIPLTHDPVLLPALNAVLADVQPIVSQPGCRLERLTLRGSATRGEVIALLQGSGNLDALAQRWQERATALTGWMIGRGTRRPEPPVLLREEVGGIVFSLSPESFFQAHTGQAAVLVEVVRRALALQPGERLLDAYSGVGTFALPLAHGLRQVVAVEENLSATADGERTARQHRLDQVTFVTGTVERVLHTLDTPFDAIILDPPRRGCHPSALEGVIALAPPRLVYVSCHPGILARDARVLLDGGYRLVSVQPVDMFPQTPHIECVALFVRGEP